MSDFKLSQEDRSDVSAWIGSINAISRSITALNAAVQTMDPGAIGDRAHELMTAIDAEKARRDAFMEVIRLHVGKDWNGFLS